MRTFPFPFLRHGASATKALHLWLALADPDADPKPLVAGLARLVPRATIRHGGGALEVTARSFRTPTAAFDDGLLALHAATPLGLAVRLNKVTPSDWHRDSLARVPAVLDVLERLVRAHQGPYLSSDTIPLADGADVNALALDSIEGAAPVAELLDATLRTLEESRRGAARLVLVDQLLERLGGLLGASFETDIALRMHLAELQGISPSSVAMPPAFTDALASWLRTSHRAASGHRGGRQLDWSSVEAVRAALADEQLGRLARALREDDEDHTRTLLALAPEELRALARDDTLALRMANAAALLLPVGRLAEALRLYDAALEADLPAAACANPLYAVQNDNNHLGLDEQRARRYLDRCLKHGADNPAIFLNASFVWMELGEHDRALEALGLAKKLGVAVKAHRNEALFAPLRKLPAFQALMR